MTSKVKNLTLPGSGEKVSIKAVVSATVYVDLVNQFPRPAPPTVRVNYGTDENPNWQLEINYADPDYIGRILPAYENMLEIKFSSLMLKLAVVRRALTDEEKKEVEAVKADFAEEGIDLKGSPFSIWIKHVACNGDSDLQWLMKEIREHGDATAGVAKVEAEFRD